MKKIAVIALTILSLIIIGIFIITNKYASASRKFG